MPADLGISDMFRAELLRFTEAIADLSDGGQRRTREAAARFTFLLSTPIIAGAAFKRLLDLRSAPPNDGTIMALVVGAVVSAIAGYLVIAFFIRYLQTRTLKIFIVYRIVFGIVVLLLVFLQGAPAR